MKHAVDAECITFLTPVIATNNGYINKSHFFMPAAVKFESLN